MDLREQFRDYLKANIESETLINVNNTDENYIDWLEAKVTSSEGDKTNILKAFDIYRKMTYCTEEVLLLLNNFNQTAMNFIKQDDRNIMTSSSLKKWFDLNKKQHINKKEN